MPLPQLDITAKISLCAEPNFDDDAAEEAEAAEEQEAIG